MAEISEELLIKVTANTDEAEKNIKDLTTEIEKNKAATKALAKTQKELGDRTAENAEEWDANARQIALNRSSMAKLNNQRKQNIKSQQTEKGTLTDLRAALTRMKDERNNATKAGSKEFNAMNEEIDELNASIKGLEEAGGDFQRSVGDYEKATSKFSGSLGAAEDAAGALGGGLGDMSQGMDVLNKVMRANPIGIIVTLLVAMVGAFAQTEEGAAKMEVILSVLNSVFKDFISLLAVGGGEIVSFFEDPLDSIKRLGDSIQNFVIRRFEELLSGLGHLGDAFVLLFEGQFEAAGQAAKDGMIDLTTSLVPVAGVIKDLAPIVKDYTEEVIDNANATVEMTKQNWALQFSLLALEKQVVTLQGQEAVLSSQAQDATKSFQEQAEAQEELEKVQASRFAVQQKSLKQQVGLIQEELALAESRNEQTIEIRQRLNDKEKELIENQNEQNLAQVENQKIRAQREQDIWEQNLDFIIDVGEQKRVVFENQALNENNSLKVREEGLAKYDASLKGFLQSQKDSFEEEGLTPEEFDRLLGIADPEKLAEAIEAQSTLSEIEKNRLREVFIEFEKAEIEKAEVHANFQKVIVDQTKKAEKEKSKLAKDSAKEQEKIDKAALKVKEQSNKAALGTVSTLFDTAGKLAKDNFELSKALGIGEAVISTAKGVALALGSSPPPMSFVNAGAIAVAGAAQVATILKTSPDTGGSAPSAPSVPSSPSNIGGGSSTDSIDASISEEQALQGAFDNISAEVSVVEINRVQNQVRVGEGASSL